MKTLFYFSFFLLLVTACQHHTGNKLIFEINNQQITLNPDEDSDHDGMTNQEEMQSYNPKISPTDFNPLVNNLPRLQIEIVQEPEIQINKEESKGTSTSDESSTGYETSRSYSVNENYSESLTANINASLKDFGAGLSATVTHELSTGFSKSISETYNSLRRNIKNSSVSIKEAKINVGIALSNISPTPFILQDIRLTAYTIDPLNKLHFIGNLAIEGEKMNEITLLPKSTPLFLNFVNAHLYASEALNILNNAKAIVVIPSYEQIKFLNEENHFTQLQYLSNKNNIQINIHPNSQNINEIRRYNIAFMGEKNKLKTLLELAGNKVIENKNGITQINQLKGDIE